MKNSCGVTVYRYEYSQKGTAGKQTSRQLLKDGFILTETDRP